MTIVAIMAGFSFGYCLMDIYRNYQSEKRLNEMLGEVLNECNHDD